MRPNIGFRSVQQIERKRLPYGHRRRLEALLRIRRTFPLVVASAASGPATTTTSSVGSQLTKLPALLQGPGAVAPPPP